MGQVIIQPEDYKYYVQDPDPSFSPQRNKAIMDEIIAENEAFFKRRDQQVIAELQNRGELVGTYGRYVFSKGGSKQFKDFIGKKRWTELIGEKILEKVRLSESANKLAGNTMFPHGILL